MQSYITNIDHNSTWNHKHISEHKKIHRTLKLSKKWRNPVQVQIKECAVPQTGPDWHKTQCVNPLRCTYGESRKINHLSEKTWPLPIEQMVSVLGVNTGHPPADGSPQLQTLRTLHKNNKKRFHSVKPLLKSLLQIKPTQHRCWVTLAFLWAVLVQLHSYTPYGPTDLFCHRWYHQGDSLLVIN